MSAETKAAHTPGPWRQYDYRVIAFDGERVRLIVAFTAHNAQTRTSEAFANARLIAAAPEYHETALAMIARHDAIAVRANFTTCGCEDCKPFRAIVAKAEGR